MAAIYNASGRLKRPVEPSRFLPDYLHPHKKPANVSKSIEQQRAEMRSWFAMYKRKEAEARGK